MEETVKRKKVKEEENSARLWQLVWFWQNWVGGWLFLFWTHRCWCCWWQQGWWWWGGKINAYTLAYSHDFGIDNNLLASPEEGRRGARTAAEEFRRSAQEGAANPLSRTSNSKEHGLPPLPPARANTRAIDPSWLKVVSASYEAFG